MPSKPSNSPHSGGVDRRHIASQVPKITFTLLHGASLAICVWLTFGGFDWADPLRAKLLLACAVLYFLRHLITLFVLLKRRVAYSEALGLSAFMALFEIGFLVLGAGALSGTATPITALDVVAIGLVLVGSTLNTGSELQRWAWKKHPTSKGQCYTGGLFRYSMHINYFGDTLLFFGWAILTSSLIAALIPLFVTASFIFMHIPALDAYLLGRYGDAFKTYAAKTAKFIPFVY